MAPRHLVVANLGRQHWNSFEDGGFSLLGSDDRGQWVISSDTDSHQYTPEDEQTSDRYGGRGCR